ncbi:MAG: hypothetical protein K6B67_02140 [Lachnospiraceae bacterium]|nr:hypothetical protein [Lachnospiraceae bacterium]
MGTLAPTAVDVICQHSKDGTIIPMRVRLTDEDGIYQAYTIKQYRELSKRGAYTTPDGFYVCNDVLVFECKIIVFGQSKSIRLYYNTKQTVWMMSA